MKKIGVLTVLLCSVLILFSVRASGATLSEAKQFTTNEQEIKELALRNIIDTLIDLETEKFKNRFDLLANMLQATPVLSIDALDATDAQNLIDNIDKIKADSTFDPFALTTATMPTITLGKASSSNDLWSNFLEQATITVKKTSLSTSSKNIWDIIKTTVTKLEQTGFSKTADAQWEDGTLRFLDQVKALIRMVTPSLQQQPQPTQPPQTQVTSQ